MTSIASAGPIGLLRDVYAPMLDDGRLGQLDVLTLADEVERGQRFGPVAGSLLSLVSEVLAVDGVHPVRSVDTSGERWAWRAAPVALLGLQRSIAEDPAAARLTAAGKLRLATIEPTGSPGTVLDLGLWAWLIPRLLELQTEGWAPASPPAPPALPSDPLERAAFLRRRSSGG